MGPRAVLDGYEKISPPPGFDPRTVFVPFHHQFVDMCVDYNRVLRKIFRPKRGREGDWRKLRNEEELHNLYSSPNIIRMFKSRRRWAGHVAGL